MSLQEESLARDLSEMLFLLRVMKHFLPLVTLQPHTDKSSKSAE